MNVPWKRALFVGVFLGGLSAVLAGLIAVGDLLTANTIANNRAKKETDGLRQIFGVAASYDEQATPIENPDYPTLEKYWTVKVRADSDEILGRVYSTYGRNAYGDISLLVGICSDFSLGSIVTIVNTESYGQTLTDEYLEPYGASNDKEKAIEEVSCGATYGAKLCREMILSAKQHYEGGHS